MNSTAIYQQIKDALDKNEKVSIIVGKNPSIDQMAAALGLYLALQAASKQVSIASPTEPLVEVSNLVAIDKVKQAIGSGEGGDLVVSFPYKTLENGEGEIQKVSYTIEEGFLNIVVKASESGLSFTEKDVRYKRGGSVSPLLFIVGTSRLSDLGGLFDPNALKDVTVVNVDNKRENQGFGDIILVSQDASSVSEIVGDLLLSLNLPVDVDIAQNLLSGILSGTDNFQKQNTTAVAFELSGVFLRKGAVRSVPAMPSQRLPEFRAVPDMGRVQKPPLPQQQHQQPQQRFDQKFAAPQQGLDEDFTQQPYFPPMPLPQPQRSTQHQQQQGPAQGQGQRNPKDQQQNERQKDQGGRKPPPDWLMPKVYRGSSNV